MIFEISSRPRRCSALLSAGLHGDTHTGAGRGGTYLQGKDNPMTEHPVCDRCGCLATEFHYTASRLLCTECWQGQRPPEPMPPTPAQQLQLADWLRPRHPATQEGRRP